MNKTHMALVRCLIPFNKIAEHGKDMYENLKDSIAGFKGCIKQPGLNSYLIMLTNMMAYEYRVYFEGSEGYCKSVSETFLHRIKHRIKNVLGHDVKSHIDYAEYDENRGAYPIKQWHEIE